MEINVVLAQSAEVNSVTTSPKKATSRLRSLQRKEFTPLIIPYMPSMVQKKWMESYKNI